MGCRGLGWLRLGQPAGASPRSPRMHAGGVRRILLCALALQAALAQHSSASASLMAPATSAASWRAARCRWVRSGRGGRPGVPHTACPCAAAGRCCMPAHPVLPCLLPCVTCSQLRTPSHTPPPSHTHTQAVYDFVDSIESVAALKYSLATTYPRRVYGHGACACGPAPLHCARQRRAVAATSRAHRPAARAARAARRLPGAEPGGAWAGPTGGAAHAA